MSGLLAFAEPRTHLDVLDSAHLQYVLPVFPMVLKIVKKNLVSNDHTIAYVFVCCFRYVASLI